MEAERAYATERFDIAGQIATELFKDLDDSPDIPSRQEEKDHWRAFLALLLGNVHLFGLNDMDQAAEWYRQVLALQPDETLTDLAKQGLKQAQGRSESEPISVQAAMDVESDLKLTELINDPFLSTPSASAPRTTSDQTSTAMPWLDEMDLTPEQPPQPVSPPTPVDEPEHSETPRPFPSPELTDTPSPTQSASVTTPDLEEDHRDLAKETEVKDPQPTEAEITTPDPEEDHSRDLAKETEIKDPQPTEAEITTQDPPDPSTEAMEEIDVLEGASLRVRVHSASSQSESTPSRRNERLSWLKQLRLWSGRR